MRVFITGQPGVGKTTLLKKVSKFCKELEVPIYGFITEEIREGNKRIGFDLINLKTEERFNFASIHKSTCYKFGKYFLNIDKFEEIIEHIFYQHGNLLILDEIGKMEFYSVKFKKEIFKFLEGETNIIASLHRDFVSAFKKYGRIYYLDYDNRDKIFDEIKIEILRNFKS